MLIMPKNLRDIHIDTSSVWLVMKVLQKLDPKNSTPRDAVNMINTILDEAPKKR